MAATYLSRLMCSQIEITTLFPAGQGLYSSRACLCPYFKTMSSVKVTVSSLWWFMDWNIDIKLYLLHLVLWIIVVPRAVLYFTKNLKGSYSGIAAT